MWAKRQHDGGRARAGRYAVMDRGGSPVTVSEYTYDGLGHRIGWHYDADTDADVDGSTAVDWMSIHITFKPHDVPAPKYQGPNKIRYTCSYCQEILADGTLTADTCQNGKGSR